MPAPNLYKIKFSTMSKKGGRIATKLPTEFEMAQKKNVPGPGAYKHEGNDMRNSGTFFLSKYVNNRSPRMHESSHSMVTKHRRMKTDIGPSSYETKDGDFGNSVLSKFRNSVSGSFGKSERPGIIDKSKLKFPGFKYQRFSDFGR